MTSYSSYPESGSETTADDITPAASNPTPSTWETDIATRVKLMVSYGGRIQPRPHDNQLAYLGGDTKILAVDRSLRFSSLLAKLSTMTSSSDDVILLLKYQLPGEDLDSLVSVTNDEDLEHMVHEYDRLYRIGVKPVPRLRLFLFPVPKLVLLSPAEVMPESPDLISVPDTAVASAEADVTSSEVVQDLDTLQIGDENDGQKQQPIQETVARVSTPEYYVQETAMGVTSPPATYWQDHPHMSVAPAARFASFVGGDQQFFLIPANPGVFQPNALPTQGYYTTVQRMVPPPAAYDTAAAMYSMAGPVPQAFDNGRGGRVQTVDISGGAAYDSAAAMYSVPQPKAAYDNGGVGRVQAVEVSAAYDSAGRSVYYAGTATPTYQTASNVAVAAAAGEAEVLKPSQVS